MDKFLIFLVVLLFVGVLSCAVPAPTPDRFKKDSEESCNRSWKDSGYSHRLLPYRNGDLDKTIYYECQVNVNGRWVPEQNVKVGP